MKLLFLSLFLYCTLFSMSIEKMENLSRHRNLSSKLPFKGVGVVEVDGLYGTGTLISPNVVLTAAHVVKNKENVFFIIYENGVKKRIKGIAICHPEFTLDDTNSMSKNRASVDIALIFLDSSLHKIPCPFLAEIELSIYDRYFITGCGRWDTQAPLDPLNRKITGLAFLEDKNQDVIFVSALNTFDIDLFCVPNYGDSGGPLMTIDGSNTIHGILSCLYSQNEIRTGSIYTPIYPHIDWILETIREYNDHN